MKGLGSGAPSLQVSSTGFGCEIALVWMVQEFVCVLTACRHQLCIGEWPGRWYVSRQPTFAEKGRENEEAVNEKALQFY